MGYRVQQIIFNRKSLIAMKYLNILIVEQYPAPLECYNDLCVLSTVLFAQHCAQHMDTLRDTRQPKSISFATEICHR